MEIKMSEFNSLPLHDASINEVVYSPEIATVIFKGVFFSTLGQPGRNGELMFDGVKRLVVPHETPWGPSTFVNGGTVESKQVFKIEMQSGDVIEITASGWSFVWSGA